MAPTSLIHQHQAEIEKFGRTLKRISKMEWLFAFIPIRFTLRLFRFSKSFRDHLVFPLTALFFGTGNQVERLVPDLETWWQCACFPPTSIHLVVSSWQTPHVSSVVVARVFLDPDIRLFDYDPRFLLSEQPDFYAFDKLSDVYGTIAHKMRATVHFNRPVASVQRGSRRSDPV